MMESTSILPPVIASSSISISIASSPSPPDSILPLDTTMTTPQSHVFLKMEDLHSSPSPSDESSPPFDHTGASGSHQFSIPPPVIVHSKPAKKRKSWGQELPEPKTALPPRKRAKTDDEKEQRRIERIKRNRAAAHNSRERKRQETETLAVALARANTELDAYRRIHGPLPPGTILPEVTLSTDDEVNIPALTDSRSSVDATSPQSPPDLQFDYEVAIKQEHPETAFQAAPAFDNLSAKSTSLKPLDPTQHSAAMLCDLQCRSSRGNGSKTLAASTSASTATLSPPTTPSTWTTLFLYLMTLQLKTSYQTILLALWTTSPSRMARLTQASTPRSTSPLTNSSTTSRMSRSNLAWAQRNAATAIFTARQGAAPVVAATPSVASTTTTAALSRSSRFDLSSAGKAAAAAQRLRYQHHRHLLSSSSSSSSSHEHQSSGTTGRIGSTKGSEDRKGPREEKLEGERRL